MKLGKFKLQIIHSLTIYDKGKIQANNFDHPAEENFELKFETKSRISFCHLRCLSDKVGWCRFGP